MLPSFLFTAMQMSREEQAQSMEQAIESLFTVENFTTSSSDAAFKAEMREKQMVYGILLHSCGLIEMTEDAIECKIEEMKHELEEASKVRVRLIESITCMVMVAYSCMETLYR